MDSPELKHCPRCEEDLSPSEFGVCRARKDGLNLYCKFCIREKGTKQREARRFRIKSQPKPVRLREPAVALPPHAATLGKQMIKLGATDRVILALRQLGPQQYKSLARACRLRPDELGEALSSVLGAGLPVGSRNGSGPRTYFLKSASEAAEEFLPHPKEPRSFGVSTIYQEGDHE